MQCAACCSASHSCQNDTQTQRISRCHRVLPTTKSAKHATSADGARRSSSIKRQPFGANQCKRRHATWQIRSSASAEIPNDQSEAEKEEAAMLAMQVCLYV